VDGSAVLVRYTLLGDCNLDGKVDFHDLVALAQNYNSAGGRIWSDGDFNYDGSVNFADLVSLAQNYNSALPAGPVFAAAGGGFDGDMPAAFAGVPEPNAVALLAFCSAMAMRRRRQRPRIHRACAAHSTKGGAYV
jgi:hypothetical protein